MKRKLNVKNCFIALVYAVIFAIGIWICASYIDTNLHNMPFHEGYQDLSEWNLFRMIDCAEIDKSGGDTPLFYMFSLVLLQDQDRQIWCS